MKYFSFFSSSLVGVDISSQAIRLVKVKKQNQFFYLEQFVQADLPPGTYADGKVRLWDVLHVKLAELVKQYQLMQQTSAINLSAGLVRMQHLHVPRNLPLLAIETEIHAQLARDLPGLKEPLFVDFKVLRQKQGHEDDVVFIAAKQDYVAKLINCIGEAGLNLKIIDIDIYSIKRLFDHAVSNDMLNDTIAILTCINNINFLIIHEKQAILFYQQWECVDSNEFQIKFRNNMQLFWTAYPNKLIQHYIVYNVGNNIQKIIEENNNQQTFNLYNGKPLLRCTSNTITSQQEVKQYYLPALGLTMRDAPLW